MQQVVTAVKQGRASRTPEEHFFLTNDGVKLFFRYWRGQGSQAIVLLHRGH